MIEKNEKFKNLKHSTFSLNMVILDEKYEEVVEKYSYDIVIGTPKNHFLDEDRLSSTYRERLNSK